MRKVTVAAVQIGLAEPKIKDSRDVDKNIEKCVKYLEKAVDEHNAEFIVFPEAITTGFNSGVSREKLYELMDEIPGRTTERIGEACKEYNVYVAWPTYRRGEEKNIVYNSVAIIRPDGGILGIYDKTHLFISERIETGGWSSPGKDPVVVKTDFGKVGIIICYDGDFPELCRSETLLSAEMIIRPSALLRSFDIWYITNCARAYDNHVYLIGVNAIGPDAGRNYYFGSSMIVDPIGHRLAQARGTEEIISATLDPDPLRYVTCGSKVEQVFDHVEDRNLDSYKNILQKGTCPFRHREYKRE
jgi:predicted amidohydrolase